MVSKTYLYPFCVETSVSPSQLKLGSVVSKQYLHSYGQACVHFAKFCVLKNLSLNASKDNIFLVPFKRQRGRTVQTL